MTEDFSDLDLSSGVPAGDIYSAAEERHGLPAGILSAIAEVESGHNDHAVSKAGAVGRMQQTQANADQYGVADRNDPLQSVEGAAKFMADLRKKFKGDDRKAIAAYNAGPGAVDKYGDVPPYKETQGYVKKVSAAWERTKPKQEDFSDLDLSSGQEVAQQHPEGGGFIHTAAVGTDWNPDAIIAADDKQRAVDEAELRKAESHSPAIQIFGAGKLGTVVDSFINAASGLGMGVLQLGAQGAESLGIAPEGTSQRFTDAVNERNRESEVLKNKYAPILGSVARGAGYIAEGLAGAELLPAMGAGGTVAQRIGGQALQGAELGAASFDPSNSASGRLTNAAVGGVVQGAASGALEGAGKLVQVGMGKNTVTPEVAARVDDIRAQGQHFGVNTTASQELGESAASNIAKTEANLDSNPFSGMADFHGRQLNQFRDAADNVLNGHIADADRIAADPREFARIKAAAANGDQESIRVMRALQDPGTLDERLQATVRAEAHSRSLKADKLYEDVRQAIPQTQRFAVAETRRTIDNLITGQERDVVKSPTLRRLVDSIDNELNKAGNNGALDWEQLAKFRSDLGKLSRSSNRGGNELVSDFDGAAVDRLYAAVDQDMQVAARSVGDRAESLWRRANRYYSEQVTAFKAKKLANAAASDHPGALYNSFIAAGKNSHDMAAQFYDALPVRGKAIVRAKMIENAIEHAQVGEGTHLSPAKFATAMGKLDEAANVFFKGDDRAAMQGFTRLARAIQSATGHVANPATGARVANIAMNPVLAGALTGSWVVAGSQAAGGYALTKLFTSEAGKRLLYKAKGLNLNGQTPAQQQLAKSLIRRALELVGDPHTAARAMGLAAQPTTKQDSKKPNGSEAVQGAGRTATLKAKPVTAKPRTA